MVSVCLPSDALLQHLPSYLGFSYLRSGGISSWLLQQSTAAAPYLDEGYLLTATPPDLECGIAPLGPPVPAQPLLLGRGVAPPGRQPWPRAWVAPPSCRPWPRARGGSSGSPPLALGARWLLPAAPDLGHGMSPPGRHWPGKRGSSSRPPPLTLDAGQLFLSQPLTSDVGQFLSSPPLTLDAG